MYTALYRKLRPRQFCDIIGQSHIIQTLTNQIKNNKIFHAYLFCGTRGTGKTSTAKVFAKALNCENEGVEPCEICISCIASNNASNMDIIEIDAASNNGVDNIRDVIENLKYAPKSKFKIYIIDEVHMLSIGAFNALLKTLEEPPDKCIFILATTEQQKIPPTIISRVIQFDFHRISPSLMASTLQKYVQSENISIDFDALEYISEIADGGLRDALSILDRAYSLFFEKNINLEDIQDLLSASSSQVFLNLTLALGQADIKKCIDIIDSISKKGVDIHQFIIQYIKFLRNFLINYDLNSLSKYFSYNDVIGLIYDFANLSIDSKSSYSSAKIFLELTCIVYCKKSISNSEYENKEILKEIPKSNIDKNIKEIEDEPKKEITKSIPNDILKCLSEWDKFCSTFDISFSPFIKNTLPGYLEDSYLYIICDNDALETIIKSKSELIESKLKEMYNKEFAINIIKKKFYDERHKAKYNIKDNHLYKDIELEKIKNNIDFDINFI